MSAIGFEGMFLAISAIGLEGLEGISGVLGALGVLETLGALGTLGEGILGLGMLRASRLLYVLGILRGRKAGLGRCRDGFSVRSVVRRSQVQSAVRKGISRELDLRWMQRKLSRGKTFNV